MNEDAFADQRNLLFTVAYEMLGSASDAEDVVQETWLRWADVDHATVRDHRAYLVRIVTRQALNRLRSLARRREDYVGEWLPEPLMTSPDVVDDVELAESVSIAMLTVLETLGPTERAVFVLREVFETPTTRSERRSTSRPRPSARLRTGHASTSRRGARACRSARRSSRRPWIGSSPPSHTAICKASSTSSRPMSSSSPTEAGSPPRLVARSKARNGWPHSSCSRPAPRTSR
jgi:RNA polymerase sigma factor (sigma-70 family)